MVANASLVGLALRKRLAALSSKAGDPDYYRFALLVPKLLAVPRFVPGRVRLWRKQLYLVDAMSFLVQYREIFLKKIYAFQFDKPSPRILDLGANIGLSVLFFKMLYPEAKITAFEADPTIYQYLVKNVHGNGFGDVELFNKAVWTENTTLKFSCRGAGAGRIAMQGDENLIDVEAFDLSEFLGDQRFDFVKMDIEGAEEDVVPACAEHLCRTRWLFIEYHSKSGKKQRLDRILSVLSSIGFRVHIHSVRNSPSPFISAKKTDGFDLQLNIFAQKESI
jgi:FkbM family methyltransferase